MNTTLQRVIILNMSEEIQEYRTGLIANYGCEDDDLYNEFGPPEDIVTLAASTFFGDIDEWGIDGAIDSLGPGQCSAPEVADAFYFDVLNTLNSFTPQLRGLGLSHLIDYTFRSPNLTLVVASQAAVDESNQKDMTNYHANLQPPRS
jgi:hypothetical protein